MRVIVTGGAGFIGSCLVRKLNDQGVSDIIVVDHLGQTDKWNNLAGKHFSDYIEKGPFIEMVRRSPNAFGSKRFDAVVHMGACSSTMESNASYLIDNNYAYSCTLAQWALERKARFLYASSAATYGAGEQGYSDRDAVSLHLRPLNMYGFSKQMFDLWVIRNKLAGKVAGFKFFNVFGPNEYHMGEMKSVIAKVFARVQAGEPMKLFKSYRPDYKDGEQLRDFIYVKDAVEIVDHFLSHPSKTGIFNVGTGKARSWNDVAGSLFAAVGRKPRIEYVPMPEAIRDKYQYFTQADTAKLRAAGCTYRCRSLEAAVKDYALYLKDHAYL
jgi:ADP-L-glycero-D-manno-heptose 6-epimerase